MWQSAVRTRTPSYAYHLLKRNAPVRAGELALTAAAGLAAMELTQQLSQVVDRRGFADPVQCGVPVHRRAVH